MKFQEINRWKFAFFTLLGMVILLFIIAIIAFNRLFPSIEETEWSISQNEGNAVFTIQTTRDDLNQFLATMIEQMPEENVPYEVTIEEQHIQFNSSLSLLGNNVPMEVYLQPEVHDNGDLILQVNSFSLGIFQIPSQQILQLAKNYVELPEWVHIHPSDNRVHLNVNEMDNPYGAVIAFTKFDLLQDEIELEVRIK
ncbi:YpmS family protein [Alkalihalobacillus sp. LMS39]|uniref:YpmS family protein n=1 Tax=Alkalihalobacillus sp. LMS39 TaxID=2924032 RepID=UPI001FB55381|nr:YpmS family protein [Alkalihalobacillus sp. LMS39]UOE95490.1 YpmS family protein [Alkalihalobacillus sp. LMS39]